MRTILAYAAVALVGLGLLAWVVFGTRYYYWDNAYGIRYRDDGWTGTRQMLKCTDEPHGDHVVHTCRWVKG
jgi:hypothetical protein